MAALYKQKKSPYWWIRLKGPDGKWKAISTKLRWDNAQQTKEARSRMAATTADEIASTSISNDERWEAWVEPYLDTHCESDATRDGYQQSWLWLRSYLTEIGTHFPRQLTFNQAYRFIEWRMTHGIKKVTKKSTALRDLKVLRLLMQHAVRTEMSPGNPCLGMRLDRPAAKEKPEFTDEQIAKVYASLKHSDWKFIAFRIALETGCRLMDTQIEFKHIDFKRRTVTFIDPKGGPTKAFTRYLPTSLIPMLKEIQDSGAIFTVELPPNASQLFSNFLDSIGLKSHCFHSTRVTYITRLARNPKIHERDAMKLVNHASVTVHRIYQRLRVEDTRYLEKAIEFPKPKRSVRDTKSENRQK